MVNVWLPYGKTEVCARIPASNYFGTIMPQEKPGVADPRVEIERALREPIGGRSLGEIVKSGDRIAIVVDDAPRATPTHLMLSPLLDELNRLGVKDENVTVIFG